MTENIKKMTTVTGLPVTDEWAWGERDELAHNVARHQIADVIAERADLSAGGVGNQEGDAMEVARWILRGYQVAWERAINGNGVPVRRAVLRSAWEVDPEGVNVPAADAPKPPPAPFVSVTVESAGYASGVGVRVTPGVDVDSQIQVRQSDGEIVKLPMTVRIRP